METIKIVVFVLGLFFGIEVTTVIPEKTIVTIDPTENTIVIQQQHLLAIYSKEDNPTTVEKHFSEIYAKKDTWSPLFATYPEKSIVYSATKKGDLNATITLEYNKPEDLKIFAIDINPEGKFSIINIPQWNFATTDGKLNGKYWNFEPNKTFSFSVSPVDDVPETYTVDKQLIYTVWEKVSKQ